ncbi:non-hydrolyzing UDP-N-acetylglucosamine 2-epimerase [Sulfurimonas diazotrophicus]|uniref:UDP-N-acetylglucosamine 2-epimerase (Non-hydrolyzing) n=1 Tax=Sulfurimonas diazotrophicus TaxID=3131939 RepID=A0ABZ3HA47_9BACT
MKILTVIGARPQFIKAATVSREVLKRQNDGVDIEEVIVHTGQHFDANMSDIFFEQMRIPKPDYNLEVHSLGHGAMTGQMLEKIEKVLLDEQPDWVLVYGDTNSTLAGALAAKKLHIRVAHVEAGLRSFNMAMPEEVNRIMTDRISDLLFCPTATAVSNLQAEGFGGDARGFGSIVRSGDVMQDAAMFYAALSEKPGIEFDFDSPFVLTTIHRAENTDDPERLQSIFEALQTIAEKTPLILPLHPRTRAKLTALGIRSLHDRLIIIDPVGYLEMVYLLTHCALVMTDSGGLQKEAFFFEKPCITLRDETEWTELVEHGFNLLTGADRNTIIDASEKMLRHKQLFDERKPELYGNGNASGIIVDALLKNQCKPNSDSTE